MNAAPTIKALAELTEQYGPMRTVLHHLGLTDVPAEQDQAYMFNILSGDELRESVIKADDGSADLVIRFIEYIDPVTQRRRFAVDYWSINAYWATDHEHRAVAEKAYEDAVRTEFARPTLRLSRARFERGLASFYDRTDVQP
ncbi:hypothetical protein [Streptomyces griseomycini]|uniref:Uncharacterized protein n=1 Tax=Streptomyces griseomycini TaxID=66895 RepID=A0A7W7PWN1_9ACTN|nr:hypothetical protein [Streptomyces griseomycini]MBB4902591.1 hypothetical protein [Streptomyces griseomycini]GGR54345.1 hypothetical protein GCM10015536_69620 [Streptomyces griseomycini]